MPGGGGRPAGGKWCSPPSGLSVPPRLPEPFTRTAAGHTRQATCQLGSTIRSGNTAEAGQQHIGGADALRAPMPWHGPRHKAAPALLDQERCLAASTSPGIDIGCSMPPPHTQARTMTAGARQCRAAQQASCHPLTCQPLAAQEVVVQALQRHACSLLVGHADEAKALVAASGPVAQHNRCQLTSDTTQRQQQHTMPVLLFSTHAA